jgi:hypothetical protein
MGLLIRDTRVITPSLRDAAPTSGPLNALVMNNAAGYFTEAIDVGTFTEAIAMLYTTAQGGSNPTLDCDLQYGWLDTNNQYHWVDSGDSFTQIVGSAATNGVTYFKKFTANFGKYIRFRLKIGGTSTPTFTVTMKVSLKG